MISIIIPVYNSATYLNQCIESIINQTYTDWECIIINDGSTDDSANICDIWSQTDSRIHVIHQSNQGVSASRNRGLKKSKGEYIVFVDSDDWVETNYLYDMISSMVENKTDIIVTGTNYIYKNQDVKVFKEYLWSLNRLNIPEGYEEYKDLIMEMHSLSSQLGNIRMAKGAVEFNQPEKKIKTDLKGRVKEIKVLRQRSAERLIENFMLAANESVATTIARKKLPFIYRVHDEPNVDKFNELADTIVSNVQGMTKPSAPFSSSKVIQRFLEKLSHFKEYLGYSNLALRCMSKAEYSSENIGHFGLAMRNYTHFTSPIRRFPDLLVHHLLNLYEKENIEEIDLKELKDNISMMAILSSERERAANDMKTAEYMEEHIGEEFKGIVTDITDKGMEVRLDNLIEGFVAIKDIEPKSFFKFYKSKKRSNRTCGRAWQRKYDA